MSDALAADPASLVFLPLGESLLARGDLVHAARVAQRGALRHPMRLEAHDLVARVALAMGDETRAEASWRTVLRLDSGFGTAHRGLGLVCYRQGRLEEARDHLSRAAAQDPHDLTVRSALEAVRGVIAQVVANPQRASEAIPPRVTGPTNAMRLTPKASPLIRPTPLATPAVRATPTATPVVRATPVSTPVAQAPVAPPPPEPQPESEPIAEETSAPLPDPYDPEVDIAGESAARLFDVVLDDTKQVALLLDEEGLIAGGEYFTAEGTNLGAEIGAHLSGVSDEAERAMRHFKLGRWTRLVIETQAATITMAPLKEYAVLVAAPKDVPLGFVRRTLERCLGVAREWLGGRT
ncbi:MAG: tetratricopeptide repeat protein [Gemmatimonadaceae bacterium]